jgi:hypothetical protein
MKWLNLLPEPVLQSSIVDQFEKGSELAAVIRGIPTQPRSVFVCVASLFAQLSQRHGGTGNEAAFASCLASCFTQQAPPTSSAEQMLNALIVEFKSNATWPPMHYMAASL